jgi:hypothetical protein
LDIEKYQMIVLRFSLSILAFCLIGCAGTGQLSKDEARNSTQMRMDITYLASDALEGRESGSKGGQLAAQYVAERMAGLKLKPMGDDGTYFQDFAISQLNPHNPHGTTSIVHGSNVVGYLDQGAPYTIVVGAHYDHLGYGGFGSLYISDEPAIHNGADDNASGVAGMLAIADACRKKFKQHNFLFIAFAGEERGLLGSNYFVKNPVIDLASVNYMINLDMVGRLKAERSLAISGVGTAPQWRPAIEALNIDSLHIVATESGVGPSDHTSFYYEGVPALHFFTGQHEDYHKPSDDVDKVNFPGLASVTKYIIALIGELEDDPKLEYQETQDSTQMVRSDFKVTLGVMPDYLYDGRGMRIDGVRPDRPAANAGLVKGDVVLKMGDFDIADMMGYMEALGGFSPGQKIMVTIERDGKEVEKELTFD